MVYNTLHEYSSDAGGQSMDILHDDLYADVVYI